MDSDGILYGRIDSELTKIRTRRRAADSTNRDLCKIPFPPDSRNPNTGFRLFSYQIPPNFTQISP
ncbi:hypothetical protein E4O75_11100 [Neisseria meningitidis]|nr:hypothetical protein [Neisseria meningitidis]MBG8639009.1 hypothetical protein [Neisseria meningitidis]MBG8656679.1 hypothetical protein [Neisseria meningitidis]MBG8658930.1 hypothetical protein [Neisseria meningitidis]MBG8665591.1 hypothetical protein [Neisseria meningitidis]